MAELYTIDKQTLTDIADALRGKYGETKRRVGNVHSAIQNTPNATNHSTFGSYTSGQKKEVRQVTFNGAKYIKVVISCKTPSTAAQILIAPGNYTYDNFPVSGETTININEECEMRELTFNNTDTITFYLSFSPYVGGTVGFYADVIGFDENDNSIQESFTNEVEIELDLKNKYKTSAMASTIKSLPPSPPEAAYSLTNNIQYMFYNNRFGWFLDYFADKITTTNITEAVHAFNGCNIENIPFDLNFEKKKMPMGYMFNSANYLTSAPRCNVDTEGITYGNVKLDHLFANCHRLQNADNLFNEEDLDGLSDIKITSQYSCPNVQNMFTNCYSLRQVPKWFGKLKISEESTVFPASSYWIYYYTFEYCYSLDEIVNFPVTRCAGTATSNMFNNTFKSCGRLKKLTFETQEDGTPYSVNWKNQTIDLFTYQPGNCDRSNIIGRNNGITEDKEVKDDATYQALKNDPDWFTTKIEYSRYNHDSAVETINSLPDTSAAGGGNIIKFRGECGSATDGGAINTLTAAEVKVANDKGWSVYIGSTEFTGI